MMKSIDSATHRKSARQIFCAPESERYVAEFETKLDFNLRGLIESPEKRLTEIAVRQKN